MSFFVLKLWPDHRKVWPEMPPGSTLTTTSVGFLIPKLKTWGPHQRHLTWDIFPQPQGQEKVVVDGWV